MAMLPVEHVVIHYSATYYDDDIGRAEIDAMHRARGWSKIGYHYVNRLNGKIEIGRPETETGAHVRGKNSKKIGICNVGGLRPETGGNVGVDTRTPEQITSLIDKITDILNRHPKAQVNGHRDHVATQCPGFDAGHWWKSLKGERVPAAKPTNEKAPAFTWGYVKKGSSGEGVEIIQNALRLMGMYPKTAKVDGVFGPLTEAGVKQFQTSQGLKVDGLVGPVTWSALWKQGGLK